MNDSVLPWLLVTATNVASNTNRGVRRYRALLAGLPAASIAAKHGCYPLRGVANYQDVYKLTYLRGPSGIIVMLAQDLTNS